VEPDAILTALEIKPDTKDGLIAILERVQAKYNYLPADALRKVAEVTGRSLVDIYGVATFYRSLASSRGESTWFQYAWAPLAMCAGAPRSPGSLNANSA
jgi:NADH:ubiquinone oxidoreductase subunit E